MEHKSYFDDFLNDVVNIDQGRLDSLETSISAIQDCIVGSDYDTKVRFFRKQGSLAHNTIIRPLAGKEFDADIVMVVAENSDWEPKDYLLDLRRVLKNNATYKDKAHLSDVCVTLNYARDKKIDILPIFEASNEDNAHHICHHRHNEFLRSEPLEFTNWLVDRNKLSGGNSFRKVTRIMKYIRSLKTSFTCPSVLLTALIGYRITDNDKDSDAFSSVPKTFVTVLERLNAYVGTYDDVPEVMSIADYIYIVAEKKIIGQGTPDQIRQDSSPLVQQFIQGEADGAVPFHYEAPAYSDELIKISSKRVN